jgi:uncharacterized protein
VQYNVASLLREPVGSTREFEIDDEMPVGDGAGRQPIAGRAGLLRTKRGVLLTALLEGAQPERCSRCLRELSVPMRLEIEEEFFAVADVQTGARLPAPEDPEAFRIDERHTLDITEAVRQYWTSALPPQPLCRVDCAGLCPRCGKDLNDGPCACPPDEDLRWSALRRLVGELEGT